MLPITSIPAMKFVSEGIEVNEYICFIVALFNFKGTWQNQIFIGLSNSLPATLMPWMQRTEG